MFHGDWATAVVGRGDTGQHLRMTTLFSLGNFCKKSYPFTTFLALLMLGLYKELWLSGAVTPARRSDDPRHYVKITALFILGSVCEEIFPIH